MKKGLKGMTPAMIPLLGLFALAAAPVQAGSVEERINAVEQELARLKGEQREMKEEAVAARAKLPTFTYRPGSGLRIRAADRSWEARLGGRLMLYMTFYDDDHRHGAGTNQGALQIRRYRHFFNYFWQNGFYELRFQTDTNSSGQLTAFDPEMLVHFEKLNPWLPYLHMGGSPGVRVNPQDTNCSSKHCGRSERTFVNEGAGVTTGSVDRGMVLGWRNIAIGGPAILSSLMLAYGIDRHDAFTTSPDGDIESDSKSFTGGLAIKPFSKLKNKWLRGMELSIGTLIQKLALDNDREMRLRTNQTRFQRVTLVRSEDEEGQTQYITPGFGWQIGPYQLRVAGQFYNAHRFDGEKDDEGALIKSRGIRILHELWLWSPKGGFLTGGIYKPGGIMLAPMWQYASVESNANGLVGCGGCKSGRAVNAGIGLWYFVPNAHWNLGFVWDHWRCTNCNSDVSDKIKEGKTGRDHQFNTWTLISRFHW